MEKKFEIYNNPLIKNNKQFLQEIMDKIPGIMKIGYQSLRKISKYFEIFLEIQISHQTIKNWSNKNHKEKKLTTKNSIILVIICMMSNF